MKKEAIFCVLLFLFVFILWYMIYPEHLGATEAYSFFVWTPDYLSSKLVLPGGLGELSGDFLAQFYRWREIGAFLQAALFIIIYLSSVCILVRLKQRKNLWIALIISSAFLLLQLKWGIALTPMICSVLFFNLLAIYVCIKTFKIRLFSIIILTPLSITFLPQSLLIVFFLLLFIFEIFISRIKELKSWDNSPSLFRKKIILWSVNIVIISITTGYFILDKQAKDLEIRYGVENAAFVSDWNTVLTLIPPSKAQQDSLLMRYSLLALSEKGLLTKHLLDINPETSNCFYFYQASEPSSQYFNSLFYAGIGLYNESVHQLFDATTVLENGVSFRSLRSLTDWFLKMGNKALAQKYLVILEQSNCHKGWVNKRKELLRALSNQPVEIPDRSDTDVFIGAYPFLIEMGQLVENDPTSKKKTDYLLCGLLLEGKHDQFRKILELSLYKHTQEPLPALYQIKQ